MKPLRSIDDLLTDEDREALRADLRRIHDAVHPCWHRETTSSSSTDDNAQTGASADG